MAASDLLAGFGNPGSNRSAFRATIRMVAVSLLRTVSQSRLRKNDCAMRPAVSIIVPVLNERESLRDLCGEILAVLQRNGWAGEILLIDDGSRDGSWEAIGELAAEDPRIRGVRLQRNFGKASALAAGLAAARFPLVATLDGDLQDDPAELSAMADTVATGGADLVCGWKRNRKDSLPRRWQSWCFNRAVSLLTGVRLHDHNCGLKLGRREVFDSIDLHGGMHRFITVLAASNGYRVAEQVVVHRPRRHGRSRYGAGRMPRGFWDLLTVCFLTVHRERIQFLLGLTGAMSFVLGVAGMGWMAVYWALRMGGIVDGPPVHQRPVVWYSLAALLAGLQILVLGFLSELLIQRTRRASEHYLIADETPVRMDRQDQQKAGA